MAHIHTKPGEHDFTVSAFIVRTDLDEPKLIMHKHKKIGKWLQFGGHVELNEDPWQALTHEILEESGYEMDQLELIETTNWPKLSDYKTHPLPFSINTHPFSDNHYHTDLSYAFRTTENPNNSIMAGESANIKLFSREELNSLSDKAIFRNVKELGIFVLDKLIN